MLDIRFGETAQSRPAQRGEKRVWWQVGGLRAVVVTGCISNLRLRNERRCYSALTPGGRLAVLVGDVRRRGSYKPIVRDVMNMESELGQLRSVIIKAQHDCRSDRIRYAHMEDVPIQHEYCVVFRRDL